MIATGANTNIQSALDAVRSNGEETLRINMCRLSKKERTEDPEMLRTTNEIPRSDGQLPVSDFSTKQSRDGSWSDHRRSTHGQLKPGQYVVHRYRQGFYKRNSLTARRRFCDLNVDLSSKQHPTDRAFMTIMRCIGTLVWDTARVISTAI